MRIACHSAVVFCLLACGCAGLVNCTGQDLLSVRTQQEVHAKLGEPASSGLQDEKSFEEYHTRKKLAEVDDGLLSGPGYAMGTFLTCGLSELVLFPYELYLVGRRTISGQTVRVIYDKDGAVSRVLLDGRPLGIGGLQ